MVGLGKFKVPKFCKLCLLWGENAVRRTFQPYWRCSHNCVYCYAKYGYRWTYWGSRSDTMEAVDLTQARKDYLNLKSGTQIEASSSCDPFDLKLEKKFELTRTFLENIASLRNDIPFTWVTKSHLIGKCVDILPELSVPQITIDSYGKKCKIVSPGASSYEERIEAIKQLSEKFKVGLRIDPIIPKFDTFEDIEQIFFDTIDYIDHITISIVKFKKRNIDKVCRTVGIGKPNIKKVGKELWYPEDGRMNYHLKVKSLCDSHGISFASCREDLINETGFCDPFQLLT